MKDYIKGRFFEEIQGIEVQDLVRESLLDESSSFFEIFQKNDREELLFRIFKHLACGGSVSQFEEKLSPYVEATKLIYKELARFLLGFFCFLRSFERISLIL